jgi:SAM-dependent methyltransferase
MTHRFRKRCKHLREKYLFYRQMRRFPGPTIEKPNPGPVQSRELALATSAMSADDLDRMTDPDIYFRSAYHWMRHSIAALEKVQFDLRSANTILEFGCGSARLLRTLRCLPNTRLLGTDINPLCVDWCRKNVTGLEFYQNEKQPPLEFTKESSIDLIFASSVFTHISLDLQQPWLEELYRILTPGGIFLCTVLGKRYVESMLSEKNQEILKREGSFELGPDHEHVSLSSKETGQNDVFQTRDQVLKSFGSVFNVLDYLERGAKLQNLLVLQRPKKSRP